MAVLASQRYIAGPQYEYYDWELGRAFDANKRNYATAWQLPQILSQVQDGHWGDPDGVSGVAIRGSWRDHDVNYAQFGGEQDEYTYNMRGGRSPYTVYYSQSYNGITFTSEQLEYVANADVRLAEIIDDEEAMAMSECLERLNLQLLGIAPLGSGQWVAAHNTPDIWGFTTILLNTNDYYSVSPRPPELNAINQSGITVTANQWFPEIARIQELVSQNHEPIPWVMIAPLRTRRFFVAAHINPWRTVNFDVSMNLSQFDQGFSFEKVNFSYWGTDLYVIFDNDMPGSGPGYADNEFVLLNPHKIQFYTMPNRFLQPPQYRQMTDPNPNVWKGELYMWDLLHVGSPKSHAYMYDYTLSAIT